MDSDDSSLTSQLIGSFDAPAFARRGRRVAEAWDRLLDRCRRQRDDWLEFPKLRLATLFALAGDRHAAAPLLAHPREIESLQSLFDEWRPRLRLPVTPTVSAARLESALRRLLAAFERFNRRWGKFVREIDLAPLNALRDGYNRYYVLEKECALRSPALARAGFQPLPPLSTDDLFREFPLLPLTTPRN